ncbi:MAG: hypothetical protein QOE70_4035 [Chthoniobacter sp.]|jgi:hypothetical protein|nr:hypothetical protein [Chthoniobacter sp.]
MLSPSILTFIATELILAGARVKFTPGQAGHAVSLAGAADVEIGTAILHSGKSSYAAGTGVGVALVTHPGSRHCIAGGVVTVLDVVKRDASGKVATAGAGDIFGVAIESGAADDIIEVLWHPGLATTVADAAVTAAKLGDGVSDAIPTVSVAVVDTGVAHTATITVQLKDAQGNNLAARSTITVFLSATSFGDPTDLGTVTATTGKVLKADTADALLTCVTDAAGVLVLSAVLTGAGNLFAHATAGGLVVVGNVAVA